MYIYKISNKINGKVYIGQTARSSINNRFARHLSDLRKNKHHSILLQRAWNKYGESSFEFSIIQQAPEDTDLNELEIYWIAKLNSNNPNHGYNIAGKIRESKRSKMKPVRCTQTGEIFESINAAARDKGVFKQHIMQQLKGVCKQVKGLTFEQV